MTMIDIDALDRSGSFAAYLSEVDGAKAGIVVLQEIFGVNRGIRKMVDDWSAKGYTALAPDLFWRSEPGIELDADKPEEFKQGIDLLMKTDVDKAIADIEAAIRTLRAKGCAKVGVVGFCFGGLLAYLTAARTDSDATVSYYGGNVDKYLREQHAIGKPLMLHNASHDHFVSDDAKIAIKAGLSDNPHVTLHYYDGDHAFARAEGSRPGSSAGRGGRCADSGVLCQASGVRTTWQRQSCSTVSVAPKSLNFGMSRSALPARAKSA